MNKKCDCQICVTGRRLRLIASRLGEEDSRWLLDLGGELAASQMDNEYYRSIMSGDWPASVEILEVALERAKAKLLLEEKAHNELRERMESTT
jgi:hypothetical protein